MLVRRGVTVTVPADERHPERCVRLSRRQFELANWISRGLTNKEIAWEMGIRESVVKFYSRRLYLRLGISGRGRVAYFWLRHVDRECDQCVLRLAHVAGGQQR